MKRLHIVVLFLVLLFLPSCGTKGYTREYFEKEEIENYSGEFELSNHILPSEDFTDRFPSEKIGYHFIQQYHHWYSLIGEETLIITVQYSADNYEAAKAYCLENMMLKDVEVPDYNGYHFIENIELAVRQDRSNTFPGNFNMIAYNDTKCKLAFMGYVSPILTSSEKDREMVVSRWAEFIEKHFPELENT